MKKNLSIIAASIMIVATTLFVSCSKDEVVISKESPNSSWKIDLKSVVDKQVANQINSPLKEKNWKGCAAADAGGALTGAAAGAEIGSNFPPSGAGWGAAIGAVVGGAAASIDYWWGRIGVYPTIYDPYGHNPNPDPRNPYSYVGYLHNEICIAAINDTSIFNTDSTVNMSKFINLAMNIINSRTPIYPDLEGALYEHAPLNYGLLSNNVIESIDSFAYMPNTSNDDVNIFWKEFQRGIKACSSEEEVYDLVRNVNTIIINSNLDDNSQRIIFMCTSVMENSTYLWNR